MIGAIIGDIVGSRFEWDNHRSKDFDLLTHKCFFTDDSVMSLAICDALMRCKADYEQVLSRSLDTTALESELSDLEAEINIASELIEECIKENAHVALDQAEYQKRYDGLVARFDKAKTRHTEVTDLIAERTGRRHQIETYLKELRSREPLTEFRETDWLAMVDYITVRSKKDIRVTFKDGTEIKA